VIHYIGLTENSALPWIRRIYWVPALRDFLGIRAPSLQ
jgi:hypothetical protein